MKRFLLLLVAFAFIKSALAHERTFPFFESYLVPKNSSTVFFVDFKISYDKLFFVKQKKGYRAACSVGVEIYRADTLVYRKIENKSVFVTAFAETKNSKKFLHRYFFVELENGEYNVNLFFEMENAPAYSVKFEKTIVIGKDNRPVLAPIVAKKIRDEVYSTISLKTVAPFSDKPFDLIIPVALTDTVCNIQIEQFGKTAVALKSDVTVNGAPYFALIGNEFVLTPKSCDKNYKLFVFENFSGKLLPGKAKINVSVGDVKYSFPMTIIWSEEPLSLTLPYVAENVLAMLFSEEEIKNFAEAEGEIRTKMLFELWESVDPDTSNAYNEILTEFFNRVDYTIKNFSTSKKLNGYKSDRGTIYIRYGKPLRVKKDFTTYNYNRVIWDYGSFKFVFVDEKGNGDYKLADKL